MTDILCINHELFINYVENKLENIKYFCGSHFVYLTNCYIGTAEAGIQHEMKLLC